jgi:hypothetical protein
MLDIGVVLQSDSGVTGGQFFFALTVAMFVAAIAAYFLVRQGDHNMTDRELTIRDQVRGGLDEVTGSVRIDARAVREGEYAPSELRSMLRETLEGETGDAPETVAEAARDIRGALADAWRVKTRDIPAQVLSLGEWAFTIAIFGTIAVFSGLVASVVTRSPEYPSLSGFLADLGSAGGSVLDTLGTLVAMFPFWEFFWAFGFAYTVRGVTGLYERPWLLVLVLVAVAIALLVLERRYGDSVESPTLVRKRILGGLLAGVTLVWAAGALSAAVLTQVFGRFGVAELGELLALLVAAIVAIGLSAVAWKYAASHLRSHVRGVEAPTRGATLLLGLRALANALRPVAILAAVVYLTASILGGHLGTVFSALAEASIEAQLSVLALFGLFVVLVGWELREAIPQIRRSLVELWARERARTSAAMRGMPYAGVAFVFLAAYAWQLPLFVGLLLSVVTGIGFLQVRRLYRQARRRYAETGESRAPVGSLLVEGHHIETIAGDRYILNLGGTFYAHPQPDELVATGVDVLEELAEGVEPEVTVEEWYADHLREFGLADYEETHHVDEEGRLGGKLAERARKKILAHLRNNPNRRAFRETLVEDVCRDLPTEIAEQRLDEMVLTPGLEEYPNGEIRLKNDIWATASTETSSMAKRRVKNAF